MIDTRELIKLEILQDKSCNLKYKLSDGENPHEAVYIERKLNVRDTELLIRRLSEIVDNYNRG